MKLIRFLLCGIVLTSLLGQMASADGWSWSKLNPLASEEPDDPASYRYPPPSPKPNPLVVLNEGAKKLATETSNGTKRLVRGTTEGTKRFFSETKDLLTWKKSTTKTTRPIGPYPYLKPEPPKKTSWISSLFQREEPKPASSLEEFMSLPRVNP